MTSTRPIDLQSTLRAVAEGAANVCEADDTVILRVERDRLLVASHYGGLSAVEVGEYFPIRADWVSGQAISGGKVAHSSDIIQQGVRDFDSVSELSETVRYRATAVAPLLDNGYVIGAIAIRHAGAQTIYRKAD